MSEKLNEIAKGSFLRVNEEGKAYWGQSEGSGGAGVQMVEITTADFSTFTSSHTGAEIAEMLTKSPVQFVLDFSGALLPLAFIGCYMERGECCVVLQSFNVAENGTKIIENLLVIPASSTACKTGIGDTYTIV